MFRKPMILEKSAALVWGVLWTLLLSAWLLTPSTSLRTFGYAQSPSKQMAMGTPSTRRPWVVSKVMIARMRLEPLHEKGYVTFVVKGEDGQMYSLDDVLAGVLELHEHEK